MPELYSFQSLQAQLCEYIRAPKSELPDQIAHQRFKLYRNLLFNNMHHILSNAFPILCSIYDESGWDALIRDFFAQHGAQSPIFHHIPQEFLDYLSERPAHPYDPPWLYELAHYEWLEVAIGFRDETLQNCEAHTPQDWLSERPYVSPLIHIQCYRYPVHQIGPRFQPEQAPETPTFLIVYRSVDEKVRFMHINAFTAQLLSILSEHNNQLTSEMALNLLIEQTNHPNPAMVINGGISSLNGLYLAGIILGTH